MIQIFVWFVVFVVHNSQGITSIFAVYRPEPRMGHFLEMPANERAASNDALDLVR